MNCDQKELRINAIEPIEQTEPTEPRPVKIFGYEQIILDMDRNAKENKRNLTDDVCRIISIFYVHGNNIDKLLETPFALSQELKKSLATLKIVYGLKTCSLSHDLTQLTPTLGRVAEAFPHVSLVIADKLNSAPRHSLLQFCVTSRDLGANVYYHFKLNYFSGLIDTAGWKAQIALFVHNLCLAKGIVNTGGKTIDMAFVSSCKISARMIRTRLAPANTVRKFTEYITEKFNFDANSLSVVWERVVGETRIPICGTTMLTPFHEQVLNQQPLTLLKWRQLLDADDRNISFQPFMAKQ